MTSDQKPGCIHPGDPEGCIGGFMFYMLAIVLVVVLVLGACGGGGGSGPELPAPPTADATTAEIDAFLEEYLAWLQDQDDPIEAAREVQDDPRYSEWLGETG
jgi:hypothetical protein